MTKILYMQRAHWKVMQQHVSDEFPLEACGLLAGVNDKIEKVLPVHNVAQSPIRFRMDPQGQYNAFKWIEAKELDLVGIFHSHPNGPASVSVSDIAEAAYAVATIVWVRAGGNWNARGYWIEAGNVSSVSLQIVGTQ